IDHTNRSVYTTDGNDQVISVLDETTCNSANQSGCGQATTFAVPLAPLTSAVEEGTHTLYVPMPSGTDTLGYVALIDVSPCNSTIISGCGSTPHLVRAGSLAEQVTIDPTTKTVYVLSENSSEISVIDAATCNGKNQSG